MLGLSTFVCGVKHTAWLRFHQEIYAGFSTGYTFGAKPVYTNLFQLVAS